MNNPPENNKDDNLTFDEMVARYHLMNNYVLKDQRAYYNKAITTNRKSAKGVNFLRATLTMIAAVASLLVTFLVDYDGTETVTRIFVIVAVIAPAMGAGFTTLADLYQWERLTSIYETARRSLAIADALSPVDDMPEDIYRASLEAFSESTLRVMKDESAQWGQVIKTPERLKEYVEKAQKETNNSQ